MKKLLMILCVLGMSACASKPLTPEQASIKILRKSDPPSGCSEIGKVHAPGTMSLTEQGREDDLKRAASKINADTVTIDRRDDVGTVFGTAFKCLK